MTSAGAVPLWPADRDSRRRAGGRSAAGARSVGRHALSACGRGLAARRIEADRLVADVAARLRGRLRTNGTAVEAFLPGLVCRGDGGTDEPGLCQRARALAARRRQLRDRRREELFQTPEGLAFVSAASLGADAEAGWALADGAGRLVLLDADRKLLGAVGAGDDVAGIPHGAGRAAYIVTSSRTAGADTDTLRLWQVVGRRLLAAATPFVLPGRLTALWAAPGASVATAVTHDAGAGRYEAFHVNISCVRSDACREHRRLHAASRLRRREQRVKVAERLQAIASSQLRVPRRAGAAVVGAARPAIRRHAASRHADDRSHARSGGRRERRGRIRFRNRLRPLVFETLVAVDPAGGLQPLLARSWEGDARRHTLALPAALRCRAPRRHTCSSRGRLRRRCARVARRGPLRPTAT